MKFQCNSYTKLRSIYSNVGTIFKMKCVYLKINFNSCGFFSRGEQKRLVSLELALWVVGEGTRRGYPEPNSGPLREQRGFHHPAGWIAHLLKVSKIFFLKASYSVSLCNFYSVRSKKNAKPETIRLIFHFNSA